MNKKKLNTTSHWNESPTNASNVERENGNEAGIAHCFRISN
jgi:hypothetical protein